MKEIGGYFGLERGVFTPYHDGVYLNSGRNALQYIDRKLGIHKVHVPHYTCPVVFEALRRENVGIEYYDLDEQFLPGKDFSKNDFVIYNNYFGVCGGKVAKLAKEYPNLIVDNAQAFYSRQTGRAAFYSPRKFFGLPDGGIVCGLADESQELPKDESWDRMTHLLKRVDLGASAGYEDFKANSHVLAQQGVKRMSSLTTLLLSQIDCCDVASRRTKNFNALKAQLPTAFPIDMLEDDVPMVYPYITDDSRLRAYLVQNKIYVALYWPDVTDRSLFSERILPLPLDQRYDMPDIDTIILEVRKREAAML